MDRACLRRNCLAWIALALFFSISLSGFAQKDFNMDEKEMVRDFKLSNSHYLNGEKLFKKGKIDKAVKELEECLKIFPRHDKAHLILAGIHLKKRDLEKAEKHILEAKDGFKYLQKWYSFTFQQYLDSLREQKASNDEQIAGLEAARGTAKGLEKSRIESRLAQLKSQNSDADTKISEFLRSGVQMPAEYNYIHGNIYLLTRRFQDAVNEYLITLEKDPRHGGACYNLATIYFMHKQIDKAREYFDKAVECGAQVNPKFKEALEKAEGK
ncbi:MAG: tetratricopeptide repeat protein [Acidobacteriota bacterium]|jgi:tetratricopeptide (TPR) repeat protein|nr:tetratricopeptide repeat protein [Acidobacteriota bacterium]